MASLVAFLSSLLSWMRASSASTWALEAVWVNPQGTSGSPVLRFF